MHGQESKYFLMQLVSCGQDLKSIFNKATASGNCSRVVDSKWFVHTIRLFAICGPGVAVVRKEVGSVPFCCLFVLSMDF